MLFSKLQQAKLNFYSKYNLVKSQQDIFSLFTLMKSTDDYIRYLEQLTFTFSIDKDTTNQSPQYSPVSSPNKKQTKDIKQSDQRIVNLTDEEKDNKFREMEHKLYKLQKLQKRFHQKIAKLQEERRRKRGLKQLKKNKEKIRSQLTNIKRQESPSPRYNKSQLTLPPVQIQTNIHKYQQDEYFDSYYDQTPEIKILDNILIHKQSNRKNLKQMLQQQKTNNIQFQVRPSIKSDQVSLEKKKQNKQQQEFYKAYGKDNIPINEANFKQIQGCEELQPSKQNKSHFNQPLSPHSDAIMQMKDEEYNPYQQLIIKINDLEIQTQMTINQQKHPESHKQIEGKQHNEGEVQDYEKQFNKHNGQPITDAQPNLQEYESKVNQFVQNQLESPIKLIQVDQSHIDTAGRFVNLQAGPYIHNEVCMQNQSSLYGSNCRGKSQREERQLNSNKLTRQSIPQNKPSALPKFSISTTLNQQIQIFSIKTESLIKQIQQPIISSISTEKPKKLNFKQALQKAKGSKIVNIQNKRFLADQQSNSRKESKNALFLNFFKQN